MNHLTASVDALMRNKILIRRASLTASIAMLNYQIQMLSPHFTDVEVNHWIDRHRALTLELESLPTEEKIQENAKRVNYSNSTKFDK